MIENYKLEHALEQIFPFVPNHRAEIFNDLYRWILFATNKPLLLVELEKKLIYLCEKHLHDHRVWEILSEYKILACA